MQHRRITYRGLHWDVFERGKSLADQPREGDARRRLYFLSRFSSRATDDFPESWPRLDDEALVRLCDGAPVIGAHAPSAREDVALPGEHR